MAPLRALAQTDVESWVAPDAVQAQRCEALASADFSTVVDAPALIQSTRLERLTGYALPYCEVRGSVTPQVELSLLLPAHDNWNGKLLTVANVASREICYPYLRRGYACMPIFRNFKQDRRDEEWTALRRLNLAVRADVSKAPHLLTLAAKAIAARFFSAAPRRSYFMGCSAGGYYAMLEAQRFPEDYDGIVAGAPNLDTARWLVRAVWDSRSSSDDNRQPIFSAADLGVLHNAVLEACDRDDGIADRIIANPENCHFDPTRLLCSERQHQRGSCMTPAEVRAIERIYAGPGMVVKDPVMSPPNMLPGSELGWNSTTSSSSPAVTRDVVTPYFDLMFDGASPRLTRANFDFERDYGRLGLSTSPPVDNPDLRPFKSAGGKLIAYLGTYDNTYSTGIIDYYKTVERTMGGRVATQDFFRFFLVPGMYHCFGGEGAYAIDYLRYLEAWVEDGDAPNALIGAHINGPAEAVQFPLRADTPISFTRPIYPYPLYARYSGNGNPNEATSFAPAEPCASSPTLP